MRIQSGQLLALGYGKFVRSDDVVAIEPITEGRGPGKRTLVWVRGLPDPLVASRGDGALVDDLVTPADEAARMKSGRALVRRFVNVLDGVSPGCGVSSAKTQGSIWGASSTKRTGSWAERRSVWIPLVFGKGPHQHDRRERDRQSLRRGVC